MGYEFLTAMAQGAGAGLDGSYGVKLESELSAEYCLVIKV